MTWYQSSSPLLYLEYGYPNLLNKNGSPQNSYRGSQEQREDKGLCQRTAACIPAHSQLWCAWLGIQGQHLSLMKSREMLALFTSLPVITPDVSIRILRAGLSWISGPWWWDSFYEEISWHCFRASSPSSFCLTLTFLTKPALDYLILLSPTNFSFSNTTVQKHQFFSTQLSSQSNSHTHAWLLEKP